MRVLRIQPETNLPPAISVIVTHYSMKNICSETDILHPSYVFCHGRSGRRGLTIFTGENSRSGQVSECSVFIITSLLRRGLWYQNRDVKDAMAMPKTTTRTPLIRPWSSEMQTSARIWIIHPPLPGYCSCPFHQSGLQTAATLVDCQYGRKQCLPSPRQPCWASCIQHHRGPLR